VASRLSLSRIIDDPEFPTKLGDLLIAGFKGFRAALPHTFVLLVPVWVGLNVQSESAAGDAFFLGMAFACGALGAYGLAKGWRV
jgi:hypothetical protein